MLDLGHRYTNSIPADGILPDHAAASYWFRRAAFTAEVGCDTWIKANFLLASDFDKPAESRRILRMIAKECKKDQVSLAKVEYFFILLCIREGNLEAAERHTLTVMNWHNDPKKKPSDISEKGKIDVQRLTAGGAMMDAWSTVPWPKVERKEKVKQFMDRYSLTGGSLQRDGERALKNIENSQDP